MMTDRWTPRFSEPGGYDCMTGAWFIEDPHGNTIATVDQSDYGQPHCEYDFRSKEAEEVAREICDAHNSRGNA